MHYRKIFDNINKVKKKKEDKNEAIALSSEITTSGITTHFMHILPDLSLSIFLLKFYDPFIIYFSTRYYITNIFLLK